jgi:hypothetical protein
MMPLVTPPAITMSHSSNSCGGDTRLFGVSSVSAISTPNVVAYIFEVACERLYVLLFDPTAIAKMAIERLWAGDSIYV